MVTTSFSWRWRHILCMTETVFTWGLKEHLPFPDSLLESIRNTCSCDREKRKSDIVETVFIWKVVSACMSVPNVPTGSKAHVSILFRNSLGRVYPNWPVWDSKKINPGRNFLANMFDSHLSISGGKAAKFKSATCWQPDFPNIFYNNLCK